MYGDVIEVRRPRLGLLKSYRNTRRTEHHGIADMLVNRFFSYTHFGVEVENGMMIHFILPSVRRAKEQEIVHDTIKAFEKDGSKKVVKNVNYKFSRNEVVERAYSLVGNDFGPYNIFVNNCEHFAMWCATGERISNQSKFIFCAKRVKNVLLTFIKVFVK